MTDRDKNPDEMVPTDEEFAGDEELEEESGQAFEAEDETTEGEAEGAVWTPPSGTRRRFGLGRGGRGGPAEEEAERRQIGSVRGTHERVHIDDRPSAIFALVCAALLLGVLVVPMLAGALPKPAGPTLSPLVVPTGQPTASPNGSAAASVSIAPSVAPSPSAT